MDVQSLSEKHLEIELRRPSGVVAKDPKTMHELEYRKGEIWSMRIDEWFGRVERVLNSDL